MTKLWDDENDKAKKRPLVKDVKVQLYQNGAPLYDPVSLIDTSLSATNSSYSYTWNNLPVSYKDSEGKTHEYVYTVEELDVDENYIATYSTDTFTITNHLKDESKVNASKVWNDNDNEERKRPTKLYYVLYQVDDDDNVVQYGDVLEGNFGNNFSVNWTDLPTVDNIYDVGTHYTNTFPICRTIQYRQTGLNSSEDVRACA